MKWIQEVLFIKKCLNIYHFVWRMSFLHLCGFISVVQCLITFEACTDTGSFSCIIFARPIVSVCCYTNYPRKALVYFNKEIQNKVFEVTVLATDPPCWLTTG